jgi:hypothetical protein
MCYDGAATVGVFDEARSTIRQLSELTAMIFALEVELPFSLWWLIGPAVILAALVAVLFFFLANRK